MKRTKELADFREQKSEDLAANIVSDTNLMRELAFNHSYSPVENPGRFKKLKRNLSRMRTILTERALLEQLTTEEKDLSSKKGVPSIVLDSKLSDVQKIAKLRRKISQLKAKGK